MDQHTAYEMTEQFLLGIFKTFIIPLALMAVGWYIIEKLKSIEKSAKRKDRSMKLTEMKIDSIAFAMGELPVEMGDHFTTNYERKLKELMHQEQWKDGSNI